MSSAFWRHKICRHRLKQQQCLCDDFEISNYQCARFSAPRKYRCARTSVCVCVSLMQQGVSRYSQVARPEYPAQTDIVYFRIGFHQLRPSIKYIWRIWSGYPWGIWEIEDGVQDGHCVTWNYNFWTICTKSKCSTSIHIVFSLQSSILMLIFRHNIIKIHLICWHVESSVTNNLCHQCLRVSRLLRRPTTSRHDSWLYWATILGSIPSSRWYAIHLPY